ncbi:MAG: hypothetical protein ACKVLC_03380 [Phycisphaerales bacterium]
MTKRPIIIHVPKTGGTTLFMAISGSPKPPSPNMLYRHIQMFGENTEMKSNCGDIFDSDTNEQYQDQQLIMMIRNPLERIESEFGFLGNREMFRELWQNNVGSQYPKTLYEYIQHPSNANSICRFLLGMPMYTQDVVTQQQYDSIIETFNACPFVFGRTDQMSKTVANVSHNCGIVFGDTLPRYRTSLYKPKRELEWESISSSFNELNCFDVKLTNEIYDRFDIQIQRIPDMKQVSFDGDEYDSLYPFICAEQMRSPLEIYANDLDKPQVLYDWVQRNSTTLDPLLTSCLQANEGDGKSFLVSWLEQSIPVLLQGESIEIKKDNPLETLRALVEKLFTTN